MKYRFLNVKYALINATFMFMICASAGYAYNFLAQSGFADGTVGMIITAVSLCGLVGQTLAGSFIDKSRKMDEKTFISLALTVTVVLALLMSFAPEGSFLLIILTVIAFTCASVGMPFLNSMAFIYEKDGQKINYGLCRGVGSAAYAVGSSLLGTLWGMMGKSILPWYVAVFAAVSLLLVRLMPTPSADAEAQKDTGEQTETKNLSYAAFFKKYDKIVFVALALVLLYFCHMMMNTYFAKIIANIMGEEAAQTGAVESVQGTALFIAAMVELPTMFLFSKIIEKVSINKILIFATVVWSVKHTLTWLCPNVTLLYFVMVLQMFAYAMIAPASVYFAANNVAPEDRNKGQAVFGVTATIGGLLASLIGGQLFGFMGVSQVMMIGVIASILGTLLMIYGIQRIEADK